MTTSVDRFALRLKRIEQEVKRLATQPQLGYSSFDQGSINQYDPTSGLLVQQIGQQYDGTNGAVQFNGPTPPVPSVPILEPLPGGVRVVWDGMFANALVAPMDFSRVEVHVSNYAGLDTDLAPPRATFESERGGSADIAVTSAGTWFVKLFTRSLSGKRSDDSEEASAVIEWTVNVQPTTSPAPEVDGGIGMLHVSWPVTLNPSGYSVEIHIALAGTVGTPIAGDPATLAKRVEGTTAFIASMPDGSPLVKETDYDVWLIATNSEGTASPSAPATARLHVVDSPDIAANSAWIGTMTVDNLTAGTFRSAMVVGGDGGIYAEGTGGSKVGVWPDGFHAMGPDPLNPSVIKDFVFFPTSGGPNMITTTLRSNSVEMGDPDDPGSIAMTLYGEGQLATGSILRMATAVQAPISAPLVVESYDEIATGEDSINGMAKGAYPVVSTDGLTTTLCVAQEYTNRIAMIDADTGAVTGHASLGAAFVATPGIGTRRYLRGLTRIGTTWYVLWTDLTRWYISTFDAAWTPLAEQQILWLYNGGSAALSSDGTNLWVAYYNYQNDTTLRFQKFTSAVLASGAPIITNQLVAHPVTDLVYTAADFGADRLVVSHDDGKVRVYTTAGVQQAESQFDGNGTPAGLVWDSRALANDHGQRFISVRSDYSSGSGPAPWKITRYGRDTWSGNPTWWFQYAKFTSPYRTTLSPPFSTKRTKRKGYRVSLSYPGAASAQVYVGQGTAQPDPAAMWLNATMTGGATAYLDNGPTELSGTAYVSNPFPPAVPAQIVSTDGGTYWKADGKAKLNELILTSTSDVKATAGNTPPLRIGDIAGTHMRLDGNELQAMTDDDSAGVLILQQNGGGVRIGGGSATISYINFDIASISTDANGLATFQHNLAAAPSFVAAGSTSTIASYVVTPVSWNASTITVELKRSDTNLPTANVTRSIWWMAMAK